MGICESPMVVTVVVEGLRAFRGRISRARRGSEVDDNGVAMTPVWPCRRKAMEAVVVG